MSRIHTLAIAELGTSIVAAAPEDLGNRAEPFVSPFEAMPLGRQIAADRIGKLLASN